MNKLQISSITGLSKLDLASLSPAEILALATAVAEGKVTLATGETAGPLAALPLCEGAEPAEGCAALRFLDENGQPTTFELSTTVELSTLTTHFSDWAIVVFGTAPPCPPDLNTDGEVNAADLAQLLGNWGPNPGHPADFNGDDVVNAADLAQLLGAWGPCDS